MLYGKEQNVGQQIGQDRVVGAMMGAACAARQSAKGLIRDRVQMLRHEADQLEALAQSLPEVLPPKADSALWAIVIASRR